MTVLLLFPHIFVSLKVGRQTKRSSQEKAPLLSRETGRTKSNHKDFVRLKSLVLLSSSISSATCLYLFNDFVFAYFLSAQHFFSIWISSVWSSACWISRLFLLLCFCHRCLYVRLWRCTNKKRHTPGTVKLYHKGHLHFYISISYEAWVSCSSPSVQKNWKVFLLMCCLVCFPPLYGTFPLLSTPKFCRRRRAICFWHF